MVTASVPISFPTVQAASEYSVTALAFVPLTLHLIFLSVAPSGVTLAVKAALSPTPIVCSSDGASVRPVMGTLDQLVLIHRVLTSGVLVTSVQFV